MIHFPDPETATPEGLVAIGGDLKPSTLIQAYSNGIFPWPHEGMPLLWFSPDPRGILDFADLHVPRSLQKFAGKQKWTYTQNQAFAQVIELCKMQQRPGQDGTWITEDIQVAYQEFFKLGHVRSVEVWDGGELVGGIYGVDLGGVFSGESMFFTRPNASKLAFWRLVQILSEEGRTWMDMQMVTPVTEAFGGRYISRREFLLRLRLAHRTTKPASVKGNL